MIGSLDLRHREVTVIGAGISGLLIAYELDRRGFEVTLLEERERAGGLIRTTRTEWGIVESAAHSVLATPEVHRLCNDLGVELTGVRQDSRARFILRGGKMRRFPLSPWEAVRAFGRAYFVLSSAADSRGNATLEKWARRHVGEAALQYLLSPFLTGVYAARPSEIAVGAAFPSMEVPAGQSLISAQLRKMRLRMMGREPNGERKRLPSAHAEVSSPTQSPKKKMMTPLHGMGALTEALEKRLRERLGDRFRLATGVDYLPDVANLVVTVPAYRAAELLKGADPHLSDALRRVSYSPLACATLFVPRDAFGQAPRGVGVLIPESEGRRCLGVLFNSSAFAGRVVDESRWVSLTMMMGGSLRPELLDCSESDLKTIIRDELVTLFKINADRLDQAGIFISRWSRAIPQYSGQLMEAWSLARSGWCAQPGHVLFGNYTGQVSLRGMIQAVDALGLTLAAGLHV